MPKDDEKLMGSAVVAALVGLAKEYQEQFRVGGRWQVSRMKVPMAPDEKAREVWIICTIHGNPTSGESIQLASDVGVRRVSRQELLDGYEPAPGTCTRCASPMPHAHTGRWVVSLQRDDLMFSEHGSVSHLPLAPFMSSEPEKRCEGGQLEHDGSAFRAGRSSAQPAVTPEPPPSPSPSSPAMWDLVMADMRARDSHGAEKYGQRLAAHDGRDALTDAYQEALDLAVYLRKAIFERDGR